MPIDPETSDPRELLNQLATERQRIGAILERFGDGDDEALLEFSAATFAAALDSAEALVHFVIAFVDRVAPVLADTVERLDRLESE